MRTDKIACWIDGKPFDLVLDGYVPAVGDVVCIADAGGSKFYRVIRRDVFVTEPGDGEAAYVQDMELLLELVRTQHAEKARPPHPMGRIDFE